MNCIKAGHLPTIPLPPGEDYSGTLTVRGDAATVAANKQAL